MNGLQLMQYMTQNQEHACVPVKEAHVCRTLQLTERDVVEQIEEVDGRSSNWLGSIMIAVVEFFIMRKNIK